VRTHDKPGAYATLKIIPILGMWHETTSTKEALEYFSEHGTLEEREEAYRILYPSYGGSWRAGLVSGFLRQCLDANRRLWVRPCREWSSDNDS